MMNLLKARQACSAAELCDPKRRGSPKLDALISEIVAQGTSKVLVFSEWVEMLKLAAQRLAAAGVGHVVLHGGVPTERRPALLDRFRESDDVRVLLATEAGGTGLNLQVVSDAAERLPGYLAGPRVRGMTSVMAARSSGP